MSGPLEQFEITKYIPIQIGALDLSVTNSALAMAVIVFASGYLIVNGMMRKALVPGRLQSAAELLYEFIADMIRTNTGEKGLPYLPFVLTMFIAVLFGNLVGMIPYNFTITSHVIVTGTFALIVIGGVTIIGFLKHGMHFLSLFVPEGAPVWLWPIIIPIEVISYISRPISLAVRLFANMMAGHTMLKVFAGFTVSLIASLGFGGFLVGLLPIAINTALIGFEILVALLQAYVFTILTCLYLKDALYLH